MKYFPAWFTQNHLLNRGYRYLAAIFPALLYRRYGVPFDGLIRLGNDYGGWYVPASLIGAGSVVYSAGIGVDVTFDEALIATRGCGIFAFDPTPFAIEFIAKRESSEAFRRSFHFEPIGLWDSETVLTFFAPKTRGWIGSYSALNLQGTAMREAVHAPVERLSTIMRRLGHRRLDLLKLDIEGAEYRVIDDIVDNRLDIDWLCVEFDQPVPLWTTLDAIRRLRGVGFHLCKVEKWNFVFKHATNMATAKVATQ